jgi:NAD(P)-dependent dehydrogenase (short-subunit alcohol dehydrogenase family)
MLRNAMAQNLLKFDGRIVIVSGAGGGGIGTTTTRMIAEAGATVIAVSRRQDNLDKHIGPMIAEGLSVVTVAADVQTDEGIAKVMDAARKAKGDLYGLVNIVGGAAPSSWMRFTRTSRKEFRELFSWNAETMFFMCAAVAAELREKGLPGSIVSVSSISGLNTAPYHAAYGAAKATVAALTRSMAVELGLDNIRVNCIAPGTTETPGSRVYVGVDPERDRKAIAMGRQAQPDEQASAILFFLSDMSSYITGQTILVDGGLNLRWTHLDGENVSLFLKNEEFRKQITK